MSKNKLRVCFFRLIFSNIRLSVPEYAFINTSDKNKKANETENTEFERSFDLQVFIFKFEIRKH